MSTDPADLDLDWIIAALSERAYWALGRSRETIERSIAQLALLRRVRRRPPGRVRPGRHRRGDVRLGLRRLRRRGRGAGTWIGRSALVARSCADPRLESACIRLVARDARRRRASIEPLRRVRAASENPERWIGAATLTQARSCGRRVRAAATPAAILRRCPASDSDSGAMPDMTRPSLTVAVVGATGVVGRTMIQVLLEREFPVGELRLLASERSAGRMVSVEGQTLEVQARHRRRVRGRRHRPVLGRRRRLARARARSPPPAARPSSTTRRRGGWTRRSRSSSARSTPTISRATPGSSPTRTARRCSSCPS